jgi:integrase
MGTTTRRSGQIIPRGKDKWLVKVFRGRDGHGKRIVSSKVISGSKSEAQKFLTSKLRELDLGTFVTSSRTTLNQHLDQWLELIKPRVAEQTFGSYESLLRIHVRSSIGVLQLSRVRISDVQQVIVDMQSKGLGARTIRYVHAVLGMAFRKAIELDLVIKNPCDFVELPKQVREETKAMSPQETASFLKAASEDKFGIIFELALITGMRPEEYLGLKWTDVNFESRTVSVKRALVWVRKAGFKFGEPKTAKSRRTIPVPEDLVSRLRAHRRQQLEHRMLLGTAYADLDLVFANEIGNPIHYRNLTQRHYEKILRSAGLYDGGFVLYSLRHTCATLLLAAGENPKVVSERLGHSTVRMTLDTYSHVLPDMQRSATEKLARLVYG